jgi:hypothetical protein
MLLCRVFDGASVIKIFLVQATKTQAKRAQEFRRIHRLRLAVVGEDDALILAVILGRVLLVLGVLAKQIGADGEFLAVDVDVELVEPLDGSFSLRVGIRPPWRASDLTPARPKVG